MARSMNLSMELCIVTVMILLLLFGCTGNNPGGDTGKDLSKGEPYRAFTSSELEIATEALAKGITIYDPQGDFYTYAEGAKEGDKRPDNANPYPLGYTDLKSFSMGADDSYLYMKYEFWDTFPDKMPVYEGDAIWSIGSKVDEMLFYRDGKADLASLGPDVAYSYDHPMLEKGNVVRPLDKPTIGQGTMMSPYGIDPTGETLWHNRTGAGMVAGGPGTDYLLSAVPLRVFGVKKGDGIIFSVALEAGSANYHHEAVDLLMQEGESKFGAKIRYWLGSDNYTIMSQEDYEKLPEKAKIDTMVRQNSPWKEETAAVFTADELRSADEALAKGVKIDDAQGDFYKFPAGSIQGDGRPDNPNPYPLGYTDLKSFAIGSDGKYLYMRYEMWDRFPETMPVYEGDPITGIGYKSDDFMFYRHGKADLAEFGVGVYYTNDKPVAGKDIEITPLDKGVLWQDVMISPFGVDPTGETCYRNNSRAGMMAGGPGEEYLLSAVPLSVLGLKEGDEVYFGVSDEVSSGKYHHEGLDLLFQANNSKFGDIIRYTIGSNSYQRMSNEEYQNLPDHREIIKRVMANHISGEKDK